MANIEAPLINSSYVDEQESSRLELVLKSTSLDEVFEQLIGDFGIYQLIQFILVSVIAFFDVQQTFLSDFTDADPSWHCLNSNTTCNSSSKICQLPNNAWAWDAPADKSIISEWSLQCSSSFIKGLPTSSYFMGCLVGGLVLATLGDSSLGRKNLLFLSSLVMSTFSLITAFSTNIWMYSALRFSSGLGRSSIMTCVLVLLMERAGKRWRGKLGVMMFLCFNLGILSLPAIAYIHRGSSWRSLYLWTSVPALVYTIVAYIFVYESPRWLIMHGHHAKAKKILARLSSRNLSSILDSHELTNMPLINQETLNDLDPYLSIKNLFKRSWALRQVLALMMVGFGVGVIYFGILLGVGNLGFNIYLSATFNALLLIPVELFAFVIIDKWNKKFSLLAFCVTSGCCIILCVVLRNSGKGIQIGFELAALFFSNMAYDVLLIYTTELFPTCVRNAATSMVRQVILFGTIFVPTLVAAGKKNEFLSYGVFGITVLFCGLFVISLPQTRGAALCDTMDEQESKDNSIV